MKSTIDLYLVSGFLGSGKTSFLKNILGNFENKKTGVLVNEFGPINIDAVRLSEKDIKMVEINNGSIFCSCQKHTFLEALIALSKEDIDFLFIENSGLADPSNMGTILREISHMTGKSYNYKGALCVVDATSFLKHVQILAAVQNQIAHSNFIVVNKTDKVNKDLLDNTINEINRINPKAFIYQTVYAEVPLSLLSQNLSDSKYEGETSNTPSNRIPTYAIETDELARIEDIKKFVLEFKTMTFRIKGYAKTKEGWFSIDATEEDLNIGEVILGKRDVLYRTKIVLIGNSSEDIKDKIANSYKQIFSGEFEIY